MAKKLVVLISGSGTNLQALIDATQSGVLDAEIALVVSNRKAAYGLTRAEQANIPTLYFPLKPYLDAGKSRAEFDADLAQAIQPYVPDCVVLAGWMHVLSPAFLDHFPNGVINLHPALPGQFAGTHAIDRAYEAFQAGEITQTGCMVHYVIPEVDAGPVIAQAVISIQPDDTLETLEEKMHAAEHELIVRATAKALGQSMINELEQIILDRKANPKEGSYTNHLFERGVNKIAQKVGEEATEVVVAALGQGREEQIGELSDLFYHTLVLMAQLDIRLTDVEAELARRHRG